MDQFRAYDFDGNPSWQQYKSNLEIPAGRDVESALLRFKAKWYKREVDADFDVASVRSESQPAERPTAPSQGSATQSTRPPANGSSPHTETAKKQASSTTSPSGLLSRIGKIFSGSTEERLIFLRLILIIFAILHIQPLIKIPQAYSRFLSTALIIHGVKVKERIGLPRVWPFKLEAVTTWLKSASALSDFQYFMMAAVFLPARPLLLAMVPFLTLAIYHVAAYGAQHYSHTAIWRKYCVKPYGWLVTTKQQVLLYNAAAEIGTGFVVILNLISPPRNPFLIVIHWQWLRLRYWTADSATYHRQVWSQLDAITRKYLNLVPILKVPIGYAQRWFQSAQTMQAR